MRAARPRYRAAATTLLAVTVLTTASGCGTDDRSGPTATPVAATTATTAPPVVPTTAPPDPTLTAPDWQSPKLNGEAELLTPMAGGFVGVTSHTVVGLDRDGTERWRRDYPLDSDLRGTPVDGVLVVDDSSSPRRQVKVLDPRTGRTLWHHGAAYVGTDDTTVYAANCEGPHHGVEAHGPNACRITAIYAATGGLRWQAPSYPHTEAMTVAGGGPVLLVQTFPDGVHAVYEVYNTATGRPSGVRLRSDAIALFKHGVLVTTGAPDTDASDGCQQTVTATDARGHRVWRTTVDPGPDGALGCGHSQVFLPTGDLVGIGGYGRPVLLSIADGHPVWTGHDQDVVAAVQDDLAVVSRTSTGTTDLVDLTTGRTRWSFGGLGARWTFHDGYVAGQVVSGEPAQETTVALDLASGAKLRTVAGSYLTTGPKVDDGLATAVSFDGRPRGQRLRFTWTRMPRVGH